MKGIFATRSANILLARAIARRRHPASLRRSESQTHSDDAVGHRESGCKSILSVPLKHAARWLSAVRAGYCVVSRHVHRIPYERECSRDRLTSRA